MVALFSSNLEGAVKYSLVELLRNVVQHSRSPVGGTALAQYFPNTGLVEVAVADFGIGVAQALRPRYKDLDSDLKALKFSLLPHVSGTFGRSEYGSMQDNAGLGLFFIKEIATRAGGGFHLGSGAALVNLWGNQDGSPGRKYLTSPVGGWPGTFAMLQLRRKSIERFESLLQVCRDLAAEARKDPRAVNLDFVDEVPEIDGLIVVTVKEFEEDVGARRRSVTRALSRRSTPGSSSSWIFKGCRSRPSPSSTRCFTRCFGTTRYLGHVCRSPAALPQVGRR